MKETSILIVEDEKEIADLVELYLVNEGYQVIKCYDGETASEWLTENTPSLAVLDIMLPGKNGFALLQEIRQTEVYPVIMLTAKVEDMDKITGLAMGADDYITKPFHPLVMVARVKAQLRRFTRYNEAQSPKSKNIIDFGGMVINRETHSCNYNEKNIFLTPIEFSVLWTLCEHRGQVLSAEQLFHSIWKEDYYTKNNTIMVHIRHIREKLGEGNTKNGFIRTVWGVGYQVE